MAILAAPVRQMTGAKVARRGVNYPMLGLALIGLAIAKLASLYWEMQKRLQESTFGFDGCTRYRSIMSPEDIIPVFEGVFIGSSEERRKYMMMSIGAEATEDGGLFAIWNVDSPGQEPKTDRLALEGFPEEYRFRPHGLHYRRETGELFVVNHAYSQGGERIDVFKVSEGFPQDPLPSEDVSLLESEIEVAEHEGGNADSEPAGIGIADPIVDPLAVGKLQQYTDPARIEDDFAPGEAEKGDTAEGDAGNGGNTVEGDDGKEGDTTEEGDAARQMYPDSAATREIEFSESENVNDAAHHEGESEGYAGSRSENQQEAFGFSEPMSEPAEMESVERAEHEGGVESEVQDDTEIESSPSEALNEVAEAAVEDAEEDLESPSEKAARLNQEAKLAAAKAKAETKEAQMKARREQAAEKAAAKEAKARASARSRGLSRGTIPIKLEYSFSVEHELLNKNYGALNDIVLASDDELYITQWLAWPNPLHGPTMPDSIVEYFRLYASMLAVILQIPLTPVMHCTGIRGPDISCERLVKGLGVMYNGIALSPNKERLLVSDSTAMQLLVFNRSLENGSLTLRQRIDLPGSPDNLKLDLYRAAQGEEAYTVGLVDGSAYFRYTRAMKFAKDPSVSEDIMMAGGMATVVFDKLTGEYTNTLDMWQDGSLLSISSATSTASGARLLGSAVSDGFLLCRPPSCFSDGEEQERCPAWGTTPDTEGEE